MATMSVRYRRAACAGVHAGYASQQAAAQYAEQCHAMDMTSAQTRLTVTAQWLLYQARHDTYASDMREDIAAAIASKDVGALARIYAD